MMIGSANYMGKNVRVQYKYMCSGSVLCMPHTSTCVISHTHWDYGHTHINWIYHIAGKFGEDCNLAV